MIHSSNFIVVLDACVLYPAPVRDLILSFGAEGLLKPKWTEMIQDEWTRNLLLKRKDLVKSQLDWTIRAMNEAFPDASVENFEDLIPLLNLPDKGDRHVLACAIRCNADLITTFNLKDFPSKILDKYDIQIQNPDDLICSLLEINEKKSYSAFLKMVGRLKNPPVSIDYVLTSLKKCGLPRSAKMLENYSSNE